jgi:hypothetical protein
MTNKKSPSPIYRYPIVADRDFILSFTTWCAERGFKTSQTAQAALYLFMKENRNPGEVLSDRK